jgi:hypothetical protein
MNIGCGSRVDSGYRFHNAHRIVDGVDQRFHPSTSGSTSGALPQARSALTVAIRPGAKSTDPQRLLRLRNKSFIL